MANLAPVNPSYISFTPIRQQGSIQPSWMRSVQEAAREAPIQKHQEEIGIGSALLDSMLAITTGGILGAVNAELKDGLDPHGAPVDAIVGLVGDITAIATNSKRAQTVANTALGILAYRKTNSLLSTFHLFKKAKSEPSVSSEPVTKETDPIVQAGKDLKDSG